MDKLCPKSEMEIVLAAKSHEGLASPAGRTIWAVREEMMTPISISYFSCFSLDLGGAL